MEPTNKSQQAYLEAIEHHAKGIEHISPGVCCGPCGECNDTYRHKGKKPPENQPDDEGSFSRQWCDTCGMHLAGARYAAHGWMNPGKPKRKQILIHLDICQDCVCWFANGDLPEAWEGYHGDEPGDDDEGGPADGEEGNRGDYPEGVPG